MRAPRTSACLSRKLEFPEVVQRQLSKLQGEARQSHRSVRAALQKLTRSPAVAKRIAAACHPDKCPPELSEVASELFRFVQSNREASEG